MEVRNKQQRIKKFRKEKVTDIFLLQLIAKIVLDIGDIIRSI